MRNMVTIRASHLWKSQNKVHGGHQKSDFGGQEQGLNWEVGVAVIRMCVTGTHNERAEDKKN